MKSELTIVIVAKDAATTIGRAVASAQASGDWPILLIDDCSGDETIQIARDTGRDRVTVHHTDQSIGIGNARQTALDYVQTEFAMWLDADDEILPHRPAAMLLSLEGGADLCFDPAILFDTSSDEDDRVLPIPDFFLKPDGILRSFERNWIPALTGGFRTEFARAVGYDRMFKCAEDYDFLLRAIAKGAQIDCLYDAGYRYAHTTTSASRNIELTQAASKAALVKHGFKDIKRRIEGSHLPKAEQYFTLAQMAGALERRQDWMSAVTKLAKTEGNIPPYNRTGASLSAYLRATAALFAGQYDEAAGLLTPFADEPNTADINNNLAVALWRLGQHSAARSHWHKALTQMPGYWDATANLRALETSTPQHITKSPLRQAANRTAYSQA